MLHGTLKLTAQVNGFVGEQVNFSGGTIKFIGTSSFAGSNTVFNGNLTGSATINVNHGDNGTGGSELLEIDGSVGRGLTFNIEDGGPPASLQIDDPTKFHGTIGLPPTLIGSVTFVGLHATSADLRDDILRMSDGKKLVDTVRLGEGSAGFNLDQTSQGVVLTRLGGAGTAIPLQVSSGSAQDHSNFYSGS
jgi:hypothetical protein